MANSKLGSARQKKKPKSATAAKAPRVATSKGSLASDGFQGFKPEAIGFLVELSHHNDRDWFKENQDRYEALIREPALAFVRAVAPRLKAVSGRFVASDKKVGGSMMRPQRDTRFSTDKEPYKTNVGIHFRHEAGKDVHAPGFYFHFEPDSVFVGAGIWHPDADTLRQVRERIARKPAEYEKVTLASPFTKAFRFGGESLKRPPRGFDPEHRLIDVLKRKDHIAVADLDPRDLYSDELPSRVAEYFAAASPFMRFLHSALGLKY